MSLYSRLIALVLVVASTAIALSPSSASAGPIDTMKYVACADASVDFALVAAPASAANSSLAIDEGCPSGETGCYTNKCDCGGPGQGICCEATCVCVCKQSCCANGACTPA